ncbi:carboxypeptidase Q [Pitangus sulphuratus]|nr:carboxypeptidase Q [Pitangus sulphuratus]
MWMKGCSIIVAIRSVPVDTWKVVIREQDCNIIHCPKHCLCPGLAFKKSFRRSDPDMEIKEGTCVIDLVTRNTLGHVHKTVLAEGYLGEMRLGHLLMARTFYFRLPPGMKYAGKPLRRGGSYPKSFEDIKNEISGYTDIAKAIIDLAVHGKAQNRSYERLAVFADTIGPRLSGSENLDAAIKYMFSALQEDGLENVHLEPVKVPHWERGEEFAMMLEPRNHSIAILGLGNSVATPPEGITAEVIVVASFDELHKRAQEAKGKIVVYNEPFISYGETVQYRVQGAVEAAKVGAVASLIRSIASFSIHRTISSKYKIFNRQHITRSK